MSQVLADAENSLAGSIFVTSHGLRAATFQLPDYWTSFLDEIEGFNSRRKTSSCGCEEINECENDPCPENSKCFNNIGSFDCICNEGFALSSGGLCLDLDECSLGNKNLLNSPFQKDSLSLFPCPIKFYLRTRQLRDKREM